MEKIEIHDLAHDGLGVGKLGNGRVIMVQGCFPGDKISVEYSEPSKKKGVLTGILKEIIVNSPHRVEHPCSHYCQGCSGSILGAVNYDFASDWKQNHLIQTLTRIGGLEKPKVEPILSVENSWNYRDRIELQIIAGHDGWKPAFMGLEKHIQIECCNLAMPSINKAIKTINSNSPDADPKLLKRFTPRLLLRDNGDGEVVAVLFLFGNPNQSVPGVYKDWLRSLQLKGWQIRISKTPDLRFIKSTTGAKGGDSQIHIRTSTGEISANPTVFTQVNRVMSDNLIRTVFDHIPDGGRILDLFGGYGAFGLEYAIRGGKSEIIDSAGESITAGKKFVKRRNLQVKYNTLDLNKNPYLINTQERHDACIVDPPRSGLGQKMRDWLQVKGPGRLIYVSCHPAALARDIKALTKYTTSAFNPIDMFPNTTDLETVAILDKKD